MTFRPNTRQLVMRRDHATGLTLVGWDLDLPRGRFEHLQLICESADCSLPDSDSTDYAAWQSALREALAANRNLLQEQDRRNQAKGWLPVTFELGHHRGTLVADAVGNCAAAAMQLQLQLTQNRKEVWAVVQQGTITHIRARYPKKQQDELTSQVWTHKQLDEMNKMDGTIQEGELIICESGLWFKPK